MGFIRKWFPHIIAVFSILTLIVVSVLLWVEVKRRFPQVEAGNYFGTLEGVFEGQDATTPTKFYLERSPNGEELLIVVIREGWTPHHLPLLFLQTGGVKGQNLQPIILSGLKEKLRLIGSSIGPHRYGGMVTNLTTGKEGTWFLNRITHESDKELDMSGTEVRLWLLLKAELESIGTEIQEAGETVPRQKAEIEHLTELVIEGEKLRAKADEKFTKTMEELAMSQASVKKKQNELQKLEASFQISQRVTLMGKLVSLARESLERERRWMDSMLRTSGDIASSELNTELKRGEKIMQLKEAIEDERDKILRLIREGENISPRASLNFDRSMFSLWDGGRE